MASDFEDCIENAVAHGHLSREDADEILGKYRSDKKSLGSPKAEEVGEVAWRARAKVARLDRALTQGIDNQMQKDFSQYRSARGQTNLREAMMAKFESDGYSGYPGVKQVGESYIGIFNAKVADALEKFHRKFWSGKRQNANLLVEVRKALHGEPTTPEIKALSNDIADAMEFMRTESNKYGGHIPKLEDWGNPQSHDENAVGNSGGRKMKTIPDHLKHWDSFTRPLLDWAKMYDPVTGELFDTRGLTDDRKASIMKHGFETIVSEGRNDMIPQMRPQGLGFGGARQQHRFFVFKDAASQGAYDREYGRGDVFSQIMSYGHSMAREIALKKVFGPNPPARVEWMKQLFSQHVGKVIKGEPNLLGAYQGRSAPALRSLDQSVHNLLDNYYDQFRGEASTSNSLSIAATIIGNVQMSALLGSSVIAHATSNWYIQLIERGVVGMPMARTIPSLIKALSRPYATHGEMLRAGLAVEDGAFNVGQAARQLAAWHKIANWTRLLPDRTTTWGGLMAVVDANKASFSKDMMGYVADNIGAKWADLPTMLHNKMAGYGIDEPTWKIFQLAKLYSPAAGSAKWLRWPEIADAGIHQPEKVLQIGQPTMPLVDPKSGGLYTEALDRAQQIAFDAALSFQNFLHGEREVAVPQSSARARAFLIGKSDKSSWLGVARASTGMFKGFVGSMTMTQLHAMQRQFARGGKYGAAHAMSLFFGLTIMGMMTYQLKQIAAGKDPVSMNPLTSEGRLAWVHAMLTGGSFGLLGDLLASEHDSYGHGWAENLMGPMINLPADAVFSAWNLTQNAMAGKRNKVPMSVAFERELFKFGRNNMPVLTTNFLTRAAWQRIAMDQLQHAVDPDANKMFKEQEARTAKETGQTYWWRPGEAAPSHPPDLSRAVK